MRSKPSRRSVLTSLRDLSGASLLGATSALASTSAASAALAQGPVTNRNRSGSDAGAVRIFDVTKFGADGDKASDATQAFFSMHQAMSQLQQQVDQERLADPRRPPVEFVIMLPPGHYRYTWNRWMWGLRRVTLFGHGATIQCLHAGPFDVDQAPLITNRDHYWVWNVVGPAHGGRNPIPEDYGRLIRTARPGDQAVAVVPGQDMSAFVPGAWVLIQSYAQQQDGYPPNMRYFERARIASIDGSVVRLDRPLVHLHKEDWPEGGGATAVGRARIVAIDRPDCPLAEFQRIHGITVASNPRHQTREPSVKVTVEILGVAGVLDALIQDSNLIALGVSQVDALQVENCNIAYTEPDKLVDRLTFENCRITSLQQCTGVNQLTLRGCTIEADAQLLARDVTVEACTFPGPARPGDWLRGINLEGPNPTRRMSVVRSRFFGRNDATGRPMGGELWSQLAIDGDQVTLIDAARIGVTGRTRAFGTLVDLLEEGWPVLVQGKDGPQTGWCSEIVGRGQDAIFAFALPTPLRIGDVLRVPRLLSLTVQGCRFANLRVPALNVPFLTWENEIVDSRTIRHALRSDAAIRDLAVTGYPRRIRCRVEKPYTGPARGCFLALQEQEPKLNGVLLIVDLRVAGQREVSLSGAMLKAGDQFQLSGRAAKELPDPYLLQRMSAFVSEQPNGVAAPAHGSAGDQARFHLEVELDNPYDRPAGVYAH